MRQSSQKAGYSFFHTIFLHKLKLPQIIYYQFIYKISSMLYMKQKKNISFTFINNHITCSSCNTHCIFSWTCITSSIRKLNWIDSRKQILKINSFHFYIFHFNELLGKICNRRPSIPIRILPFLVHFSIGSGHASARQLSISIEPLTGRWVNRGNLIVNVGCAKYRQIKYSYKGRKW